MLLKEILLTDREISQIEGRVLADIKSNEHIQSRVMREVANAQIKKVEEWGNGECVHQGNTSRYIHPLKRHCADCWQVLRGNG